MTTGTQVSVVSTKFVSGERSKQLKPYFHSSNRCVQFEMGTHRPYHEILGHPHDFEVEYRILMEDEGGRKTLPRQGIRWDFIYPNDAFEKTGAYMIWPEHLDENGDVILTTDIPVPKKGMARMWIIDPERREFHRTRIKEGLVGYSVEGARKVAECRVTKIVGLPTNPTTQEEENERKTAHNNR